MTGPCSSRSVLRATTSALLLPLASLALVAPALAADGPPAVASAKNVAGSRDALGLVNLGDGKCAIHTFVAVGGALDRVQSWKGTLAFSRARFVAGDVNGDGLTDGIVLYNMGDRRARLYVMLSNGTTFTTKKIAWTSAKGAFTWSRAKLAVGDVNADGKDDVVVLYDRGRGRAELQRFVSKGSTFKMSVGWKCGRGGLYASRAQLALGDATGDGKADAIVLYRGSPSRLLTFATKGSTFVKKTFWKGTYPAAKLAAGDLDSDGDVDAVCLRDDGDGRMALDAFLSDKAAFAAPAPWWLSAAGAVGATARLACGDLDANGMADAVLLTPTAARQLRRRLRLDGVGLRAGRLVARTSHRGLDPSRLRLRLAHHPSREDGRPRRRGARRPAAGRPRGGRVHVRLGRPAGRRPRRRRRHRLPALRAAAVWRLAQGHVRRNGRRADRRDDRPGHPRAGRLGG